MTRYVVDFERKKKSQTSWSFKVMAENQQDAERIAQRQLSECGERPLEYKKPKTKEASDV